VAKNDSPSISNIFSSARNKESKYIYIYIEREREREREREGSNSILQAEA
jgi:hypothetical protein